MFLFAATMRDAQFDKIHKSHIQLYKLDYWLLLSLEVSAFVWLQYHPDLNPCIQPFIQPSIFINADDNQQKGIFW